MAPRKTVVILGGAYGGARAAQVLAAGVPEGWRIIVIDRNSHVNRRRNLMGHTLNIHADFLTQDVYVMPRFSVVPDHEYKAFVPVTRIFLKDAETIPHLHLQAHVVSLTRNAVTLDKSFPEHGIFSSTINFDYAIYALGSHLPRPLDLWGTLLPDDDNDNQARYHGEKDQGIKWLQAKQKSIEAAPTILVVGGGALGIQFATDIAAIYPNKKITLLHSRNRLLPRFDEAVHFEILRNLKDADIEVILGERLDLSSVEIFEGKVNAAMERRIVRTSKGREIEVDLLLLCTGQMPNTQILQAFDPGVINPDNSLARNLATYHLATDLNIFFFEHKKTPYPNIFVIGDAADAFGAIPAGYNAYFQGEVAARNVLRFINRSDPSFPDKNITRDDNGNHNDTQDTLERYSPGSPAIKVSLGLTKSVYQSAGIVGTKHDGVIDLQAGSIWPLFGMKVFEDEDMIS